MKTSSRLDVAARKLHYHGEEALAVTDGKPWEIIVFGLLVIVLFPLLVVEVAWLLLTGRATEQPTPSMNRISSRRIGREVAQRKTAPTQLSRPGS